MKLFEPLLLPRLALKNRIIMPPMVTNFGVDMPRGWAYYGERARGGAALVIVEATVSWRLFSQPFFQGVRRLAEVIHEGGALAGMQLIDPGRLPTREWVAPSATDSARQATVAEVESIVANFGTAAARVKDAGFDVVEVHGAHGYFPSQFFSPRTNRRDDKYGGDLERRMTFGLEVVAAMRQAVGDDFPIFFRLSAVEFVPGGATLEDSIPFAVALERASVDVLDVSAGLTGDFKSSPARKLPMGTHAEIAAAIKKDVKVPVIAVGRINAPQVAEDILEMGQADLVAVGRQLICDPSWPKKVAEGRFSEVLACKSCNKGCAMNAPRGVPIHCITNKRVGFEYEDAPWQTVLATR